MNDSMNESYNINTSKNRTENKNSKHLKNLTTYWTFATKNAHKSNKIHLEVTTTYLENSTFFIPKYIFNL